jgi:hypothetical protein
MKIAMKFLISYFLLIVLPFSNGFLAVKTDISFITMREFSSQMLTLHVLSTEGISEVALIRTPN